MRERGSRKVERIVIGEGYGIICQNAIWLMKRVKITGKGSGIQKLLYSGEVKLKDRLSFNDRKVRIVVEVL